MMNPLDFLAPRRGYDTRFDREQVGTGGNSLGEDVDAFSASKGKTMPSYGGSYNPVQEGDTARFQIPKWAPGEFEEWKQAKVLGIPTQYGWNQQMAYKNRKLPNILETSQMPVMNGAIQALLKKFNPYG